jgi:L-arabinose isomerase
MQRLRVGYVGVAYSSYYAEENDQYGRARRGLEELSRELNFDLVAIPYGLTDMALTEQAAAELRAQKVDLLLLQTAACALGEQILTLRDVAPYLGLWATPNPAAEGPIQLHSFVSMSHYASILKRYLRHEERSFKWFYGHVEEDSFRRRFAITVRALTAIKKMAAARIGWVGGLSPGFYNMQFDERKLFARFGLRVAVHELAEVVEMAKTMNAADAAAVGGELRLVAREVATSSGALDKGARLYLALKQLATDNGYDALAVECWPKFQALYGVAPCMAYSWLGSEDNLAVACEGDVLGAASMLLLNYLTGAAGSATLLDLAAIDPASATMLMWHCGVTPRHWANKDGVAWVDHTTLGRKSPTFYGVAGDLVFAPQATTITYIGDDISRLLVLSAQVVERETKGFDGTRGWFSEFALNGEPISMPDLVNTLIVRGHEHHYAVGQGDVSQELLETAAWLKLQTVDRVPARDYLQMEGINVL